MCVYVFVSGCQYQCNRLQSMPGKAYLRSDLLCVYVDVKPINSTELYSSSKG